MKNEHLIWDSQVDYKDWKADMEENYPDLTEEERILLMYELNNEYLDDERSNLNIQLETPIIAIGDIGRWYGRVPGYKMIESRNIRDCLRSEMDDVRWYVDELGDLRSDEMHHDGRNYILYRAIRPGVTDHQLSDLQNKILSRTVTKRDVNRMTVRMGDEISKVYGWQLPNRAVRQFSGAER